MKALQIIGLVLAIGSLIISLVLSNTDLFPRLKPYRLHLFVGVAVLGVGLILAKFIEEWGKQLATTELEESPTGSRYQRATDEALEDELRAAADEKIASARSYFQAGQRDHKAAEYRDAATNYRKSVDELPTMAGLLNLGVALLNISEFDAAVDALAQGARMARESNSSVYIGAFNFNLGTAYADQGNLDSALEAFKTSLTHTKNPGKALLGSYIGRVHLERGEIEQATEQMRAAVDLAERENKKGVLADVLANWGRLRSHQGDYQGALKALQRARTIAGEVGSAIGEAHALESMGIVYSTIGNYDQAEQNHKRSIELYTASGSLAGQANALSNLGQT